MITNELISEIKSKINDNQKQAITGGILQGVLVDMVKSLCEVYPQTYTEDEKAQARANIDVLSDYEVGHKLGQKLDNTSTLTDTEVNNIWDNN